MESRLPWEDIDLDGKKVRKKRMGWNVLLLDLPGRENGGSGYGGEVFRMHQTSLLIKHGGAEGRREEE